MLTNTAARHFDVIEITNELPINRRGGVGSVIAGLISGFNATDVRALWYLLDHHYGFADVQRILHEMPNVAVGSLDELRHFHAHVAHLHTYNHDPSLLHHLARKKTVFTIHSLLHHEALSNDVDMSWAITQQERMIRGCDRVILVSEAELHHYCELGYQQINPDVHVIYNGLASPPQISGRDLTELTHNAPKYIGFCGRLVPRKRPEYVQQILKEKDFEGFRTLIAGRGFGDYARHLMEDSELRHRVRYLGWCAGGRLEAFYDAIAVLAIPSVYEPFGMVAVEAMARGVPVVCTRVGGLVEILGDAGIYAEDHSYPAFRQAMLEWRHMAPQALAALAQRAQSRYRERFSDISMARNYQRHFRSVQVERDSSKPKKETNALVTRGIGTRLL